uniref:C-type lectin domain-containing protein n=1 Tax=Romanomermis culicivorax TaxID=13658 RepID=A0A915IW60_ROMCU
MFVNRQESSKSKYDPDPASMIRLTFDHQNPKHKFCCETLHAKYGCFFVSVAELLFTICLFINELIKYCTHDGGKNAKIYQEDTIIDDFDDLLYDHSPVPMILYGVLWIITIIFVICLLIGTFLKREKLIFAHMVFQIEMSYCRKTLTIHSTFHQGYAFESCSDSSTSHGNCTVIEKDGAIGSQSINSIWLQNGGYSDFGLLSGCPYQAGACSNGFSFYGWVKFHDYVSPCENFGVYVTNQQFAIHLLGNGRLAAYVWMNDDTQWYAESAQPISLNIWHPLILQFNYNLKLGNGTLWLVVQGQLVAFSNCTDQRTYKPPLPNHLFGSDGVNSNHSTSIQIDRTNWDSQYRSLQDLIGILFDPPTRIGNCQGKPYSTLTRQFQCFWLENSPLNWTDAYQACNK